MRFSSAPQEAEPVIIRPKIRTRFPPYFDPFIKPLDTPLAVKVLYGGRGAAKSHSVAKKYVIEAAYEKHRYLCGREFQSSMKESVIKLLTDKIYELNLQKFFDVQRDAIYSTTGSEFMFKGIHRDPNAIRSAEGIDRCWIEEAQVVSSESWDVLLPTLFRRSGCELFITFNPDQEDDATFKRFVLHPPKGSLVKKVNWNDNPWFPAGQNMLREHQLEYDPEAYDWIWNGNPRKLSDAAVFRSRWEVQEFEQPEWETIYYFGADWGFGVDPSVLIRCFIYNDVLYVDHEAYGYRKELDELPAMYDEIFRETAHGRNWLIKADNQRPETIAYMAKKGFRIEAAEKWPGSIEDGIAFLKQFKKIVIHPRCKNIIEEFKLYSYKKDPRTDRILPMLIDHWNHGIDSLRYALDSMIRQGDGYFNISDDALQKIMSARG